MITLNEIVEQYKARQIEKQIAVDIALAARLQKETEQTRAILRALDLCPNEINGNEALFDLNGEPIRMRINAHPKDWNGFRLVTVCMKCGVEIFTPEHHLDIEEIEVALYTMPFMWHACKLKIQEPEIKELTIDEKLLKALSDYVYSEVHRYDE